MSFIPTSLPESGEILMKCSTRVENEDEKKNPFSFYFSFSFSFSAQVKQIGEVNERIKLHSIVNR